MDCHSNARARARDAEPCAHELGILLGCPPEATAGAQREVGLLAARAADWHLIAQLKGFQLVPGFPAEEPIW